jgi:hypothetical protein
MAGLKLCNWLVGVFLAQGFGIPEPYHVPACTKFNQDFTFPMGINRKNLSLIQI